MPGSGRESFERMLRDFLAQHPTLRHEWRPKPSRLWGFRLDLVLTPPSADVPEVWATLNDVHLTVGAGDDDRDFEAWGRPISEEAVVLEAFEQFVDFLEAFGYIDEQVDQPPPR